jgi:hypothetical protein
MWYCTIPADNDAYAEHSYCWCVQAAATAVAAAAAAGGILGFETSHAQLQKM